MNRHPKFTNVKFSKCVFLPFILPVMNRKSLLSCLPRSPEWSHPSASSASSVLSGMFRYPMNTCLPQKQISPFPSLSGLSNLVLQPVNTLPQLEEEKKKHLCHIWLSSATTTLFFRSIQWLLTSSRCLKSSSHRLSLSH